VALAARGSRQMAMEVERIEDPEVVAQVRRQALKVQAKGVAAGLVLTFILCFLF